MARSVGYAWDVPDVSVVPDALRRRFVEWEETITSACLAPEGKQSRHPITASSHSGSGNGAATSLRCCRAVPVTGTAGAVTGDAPG